MKLVILHPRLSGDVEQSITVKPYNTQELCHLYQVPYKTMYRWLKPLQKDIGRKRGRFYTILQVRTIFLKLGEP